MQNEAEKQLAQEKMDHVMRYGNLTDCRRRFLLRYFNEQTDVVNCGNCDSCAPRAPLAIKAVSKLRRASTTSSSAESLPFDKTLFDELRTLRTREAARLQVPPYIVFGDKALQEMAAHLPQTPQDFLKINGVGNLKLSQFGELFMAEIRRFVGGKSRNEDSFGEPF
jgi:ATP-dependent DNA helicase RecQ